MGHYSSTVLFQHKQSKYQNVTMLKLYVMLLSLLLPALFLEKKKKSKAVNSFYIEMTDNSLQSQHCLTHPRILVLGD